MTKVHDSCSHKSLLTGHDDIGTDTRRSKYDPPFRKQRAESILFVTCSIQDRTSTARSTRG